jgi:hypothetical protein
MIDENELHARLSRMHVAHERIGKLIENNAPRTIVLHEVLLQIEIMAAIGFILADDTSGPLFTKQEFSDA